MTNLEEEKEKILNNPSLQRLFERGGADLTKQEEEYAMMWAFWKATGIHIHEFMELYASVSQRPADFNKSVVDRMEMLYCREELNRLKKREIRKKDR